MQEFGHVYGEKVKNHQKPGMVTHAYNSSYSEGGDREDCKPRPV
jgi:hypothetical protein